MGASQKHLHQEGESGRGDPLSPYIYILCSEVLSRLLLKKEVEGHLNGIKMSRTGPSITHLMYADDTMLFTRADAISVLVLQECTSKYCSWSGQKINAAKSRVTFSDNCGWELKGELLDLLGFDIMDYDEKFLGNPLFIRKNCGKNFQFVVDKVAKRLEGWKARLLSQAARTVLVKSVVQTIPSYSMAVFKLPGSILEELDKLTRRFWWKGDMEGGRYLSLIAWENLCKPKVCGGLGFRRAKDMNMCYMAKLAWLLARDGGELWVRMIKSKYFPNSSFFDASLSGSASIVARSIWSAKQLVVANSAWRVGSESDVNLWNGRWIIGDDVLICAGDINPTVKPRIVLGDLLQADSLAWDIRGVEDIFRPSVAAVMVRFNPLDLPLEDELVWTLTPRGNFTLKSVYWALNANSLCSGNGIFKKIWYGSLHPRLQLFVWKLYADALPTGSRLGAIFGNEPDSCALCDCPSGNTTSHLFWECEVAKRLWFISKWNVRIDSVNIYFGRDLVEWIFNAPFLASFNNSEKEEFICFAVCLCYSLWRFRNEAFHSKKVLPFEIMHKQVEREFAMFSLKPCKHKPPNTPGQDVGFTREIHSGLYQVWVDAAFHAGGAAIGVIIKNSFNQLQALFACKVEAHSVIAGELQAIIKGIEALQLLGVDRGCFFSDCQMLTVAAKEKRPPSWSTACSFSKLLRAIEGMGVSLVWIPRSENSGAHTLAKWALHNDCNGFVNFWEITPSVFNVIFSF
ncbi:uncharacterized protein LOC133036092 [Cannabis sativa]|uniref:uncharacterized protein LOC133036092 n=1 Tax=Cannabis sativa TaxID=3483 RepID=UPI0029C9E7EB|nr:uncharacterized protein LOC133036092 [Cannabis sativa]